MAHRPGKENCVLDSAEAAGQRAAALQSLLETARLNGIEPMAWLTDTFEKLPTWTNSRLDELLPLRTLLAARAVCARVARWERWTLAMRLRNSLMILSSMAAGPSPAAGRIKDLPVMWEAGCRAVRRLARG